MVEENICFTSCCSCSSHMSFPMGWHGIDVDPLIPIPEYKENN